MFFETEFSTVYARNNKAKNAKHMRCFPSCASSGHVASSFCGSSVSVLASMPPDLPTELQGCFTDPSLALAIGFIVDMQQFDKCEYAVGQLIPHASIQQTLHTGQTLGDPGRCTSHYAGEVTAASMNSLRIVVAPHKRRIWRYITRLCNDCLTLWYAA
jgi:hypothetical protein